jgi:hypothetical protein
MSYFAAACGSGIGMMIAMLIFANAWRFGLLPKDYDLIHEYGKSMVRIDNKKLTYTSRLIIGTILHPVVFVFIWGKDGLMGIYPFNSSILSAIILLIIESSLFSIVLWKNYINFPPRELVKNVIFLQFIIHIIIGFSMGLSYEMLLI